MNCESFVLIFYRMVKTSPAPFSMPVPLLYFSLDPCTHKFVAWRIAIDNLVCTQPIITQYIRFALLSGKCSSNPLHHKVSFMCHQTIHRRGKWSMVRLCCLSIFCFLLCSKHSIHRAVSMRLASVSMTWISNNASACGCHIPLRLRSATRTEISLASSASFTTGSLLTSLYANAAMSP